jgi:WD40 repeat protein
MLDSPVHAVAVGPRGAVAIARDDSVVTLIHSETEPVDKAPSLRGHQMRVFAAAWSPDGSQLVTAGEDESARVCSPDHASTPTRTLGPHNGIARSVAYSRDGRMIATASEDGQIRLWNAADGALRTTFGRSSATPRKLVQVAFGTGNLLASLDDAGEIILWDAARSEMLDRHPRLTEAAARAFAFSHDGARIAVSSATDSVIHAVTATSIGRRLAALDPPTGAVRAVAFSLDDSRVFTAGDAQVRIWDAAKGKLIATRDAPGAALETLALSADGNRLWAGGEVPGGGVVRAWHVRGAIGYFELLRARGSDPWQLCDDDVVRLKEDCDAQR